MVNVATKPTILSDFCTRERDARGQEQTALPRSRGKDDEL